MGRLIRFAWERKCPACGDSRSRLSRAAQGEGLPFHAESFSARKAPEIVYPAYRRCETCRLFYASPALSLEDLAYGESPNIAEEEAEWAARSYASFIRPWLLGRQGLALDIGCGDGAFLSQLDPQSFERVGFDPSAKASRPGVIVERKTFTGYARAASLITAFQVLEHVPHPLETLKKARETLAPAGMFFTVSHDERAWAHRALGKRSPMLDLQHYQLFSPATLRRALLASGFSRVETYPFKNTYPLHYWAKLAPLPSRLKHWLRGKAWSERPLQMALGNFATLAWR